MGTKTTAQSGTDNRDYWLMFCRSENMPPSRMLTNTPEGHLGMLTRMKGCEQDREWHPEGDVWVHTGQVCDMMHTICLADGVTEPEQQTLMMAALLHDNAKPETSFRKTRDGVTRIVAPKHAEKGAPKAYRWLLEQGFEEPFAQEVAALVKCHMRHLDFVQKGDPDTSKRNDSYTTLFTLTHDVRPSNLYLLAKLVEADISGRVKNPAHLTRLVVPQVAEMVALASQCQVLFGI